MGNRTVLITGSSRGIGFGMAKAFARQGDRIVLNAREDAATLAAAVDELKRLSDPLSVTGILADMSDYEAAKDCFRQTEAMFGPVEVLVNNAGAAHFGLFTDMSPALWEEVFRQNLFTTFNACQLAVPALRANHGVIINVSSVQGLTGASCEAVYAAAKAAVNTFTKSLAQELGPSGVRVNAIAYGAFNTRMNDRLTPEEKEDFITRIPLMRFAEADEAGALAVFLASEGAAYLTGQIIALDGGLT